MDLHEGQRRAARVSSSEVVSIAPITPEGQVSTAEVIVQLNDASERGIGFMLRDPLAFGQHFIVRPQNPARPSLLYRVACCTRLPQQMYKIGAEFLCVLTTDRHDTTDPDADQDATVRRISQAITA